MNYSLIVSTDRNTDGLDDNPARAFVRDFLRPYLGDAPDTKFFLIGSNNRFYASVAKKVTGIDRLVRLYLRPISQRHYEMIGRVYGDSFANVDSSLDLTDRFETYASIEGKNLSFPDRRQREHIDKIQSK